MAAVRYVERLSRLAFTGPSIVEAICRGRQPAELNVETLFNRIDLPTQDHSSLGFKPSLNLTSKISGRSNEKTRPTNSL